MEREKSKRVPEGFLIPSIILTACAFSIFLTDNRYDALTMLSLEFAPTPKEFLGIMREAGYSKEFIRWCLYIDFAFIAGFTSVFVTSALLAFKRSWLRICAVLAAMLVGLLDVAEDLMMISLINRGMDVYTYRLLAFIEDAKWILVPPNIAMSLYVIFKNKGRRTID